METSGIRLSESHSEDSCGRGNGAHFRNGKFTCDIEAQVYV